MRLKQRIIQIVQFINSIQNKKDYLTFLIVVGGLIYFLNNAFCLFYGEFPGGKMNDEGVMLAHKIDDILIKRNYCKDYYSCTSREIIFFEETCSGLEFSFYGVNQADRKEIVDEIKRYSTSEIQISFYEQSFEPGFFEFPFATTKLHIKRKTQ